MSYHKTSTHTYYHVRVLSIFTSSHLIPKITFSDESAFPAYPAPVYDQGNFDYSSYNEVNTDFSSYSGFYPVDRQDIVTAIGDVSYFSKK